LRGAGKSNFCRFYASHFSFKSAPPIIVVLKAWRDIHTKRSNITMMAAAGATKTLHFYRPRLKMGLKDWSVDRVERLC
jgi:hypothetical protein